MKPVDFARKYFSLLEIENPPVELRKVLNHLKVHLKPSNKLVFIDAVLFKDEQFPLIVYNANRDFHRQRFSIAHEIGHFVLPHRSGVYSCMDERSETVEEIEANEFAAELLMPEVVFREKWEEYEDNPFHRIGHLSSIFGVSLSAVKIRSEKLRLR